MSLKSATSLVQSPLLSSANAAASSAKLSPGTTAGSSKSSLPPSQSVPLLTNLINSPQSDDAAPPEPIRRETNQPPNEPPPQPPHIMHLPQNKLDSKADLASQPAEATSQTSEATLQLKEPVPLESDPSLLQLGFKSSCLRSDTISSEADHTSELCTSEMYGKTASQASSRFQSTKSCQPISDLNPPVESSRDLSSQIKQDQSAPVPGQTLSEMAVPQSESIPPQSDKDMFSRDNTSLTSDSKVEVPSATSPSHAASSTTMQLSNEKAPQFYSDGRISPQNRPSVHSSDSPASQSIRSPHPSPNNQLVLSMQIRSSQSTPNELRITSTSYISPGSAKFAEERNRPGTDNLNHDKMSTCKSPTDTSSGMCPQNWKTSTSSAKKANNRASVEGHKSLSAVSTGRRTQGIHSRCMVDVSGELTLSTRSVDQITIGTAAKGFSYSRESLKAASLVYGSNSSFKKNGNTNNKPPESNLKESFRRRSSSSKTEISHRPRGSIAKQLSLRESKHGYIAGIQSLSPRKATSTEKIPGTSTKKHQQVVNSSTGQPEVN